MQGSPQTDGADEETAFAELFAAAMLEDMGETVNASPAHHNGYFPRHLQRVRDEGLGGRIDEAEFLSATGPKIILGEPGMGKTELIREFGRRLEVEPVGAVRFMLSKDPAKFVQPGKPLLVDALDEAMSRREGDAIDVILSQLEAAGAPDFILSCRAREWQARGATSLAQIYSEPSIFSLQPLSRPEALAFLEWRYGSVDAETVLSHLDRHNLPDLYQNPLTLGLMGRVAETDTELPATRAALLERVCVLIWPEHDSDRQETGLAQLGQEEALAAAGAVCAALLFSGAEAVSITGAAQALPDDIRLAEVEMLPDAGIARTILSSKLFQSAGVARIKPIHRVIAEFLAARWLARQASAPRTQRRLLAQLHGGGAVPASLRGLHAWLAFHSSTMAERVIRADPFGILRYGEANAMTPQQADYLFEALCALADEDPYFRATDWDSHTAGGLMIPALREKIAGVIASNDSNEHLRSLLIEAVRDTPIAADLAAVLETVVLSKERFYREREDAAEAILPLRNQNWWWGVVEQLRQLGDEDSTRLARRLIELVGVAAASPHLLVEAIFAEMGLTICPLPRAKDHRSHTVRYYAPVTDDIPSDRLVETLDLIAEYAAALVTDHHWQDENDIADLISNLIVRAIDEQLLTIEHAGKLWSWLARISEADRYHRNNKDELAERLSASDTLRRAVQRHALNHARPERSLWMTSFELGQRLVGLWPNSEDVVALFDELAEADNEDEAKREDWQDLVRIATGREGIEPNVLQAAERFVRDDKQLRAFLRGQENPKRPKWERDQERRTKERKRKQQARIAIHRQDYAQHKDELEAGELGYVRWPAEAYLGRLSDISNDLAPAERVADWLGPDLRDSVLVGFEAALHRVDLPTPEMIAEGLAKGTTYYFSLPIMAGMLERQRSGKGFADVPADVCIATLLLCHNDWTWRSRDDVEPGLCEALEAQILTDVEARKTFCRLWIERSLEAKRQHVPGLYKLAHDKSWHAAASALAAEWLAKFTDLPENVELDLVDCLTRSGALTQLAVIAEARSRTVFRNFEHMLSWLAIDVLVRFDAVQPDLEGIGERHPEFIWYLRNRIQLERRGASLPLGVAQREWIISSFRGEWPYATLNGSGSGDTNPYDATDFFRALIGQLANDTSVEAGEALRRLSEGPTDTYTDLIRHMTAEQRQKRAEETFDAVNPTGLRQLLAEGPPSNADDLKSLVLEELMVAQKKLLGEDIDQVRDFWTDAGIPRDENRCRDRLAAIIGPELARHDVLRITEADMPNSKRADLAYARGQMQLPMEVKGQWHDDVWDAATSQLDLQYLIDWRSEQRGIYCVLWFGEQPSSSGRRLRAHPEGLTAPKTPEQMRQMIVDRIPEARRPLIDVVVLDFTAGRRTKRSRS